MEANKLITRSLHERKQKKNQELGYIYLYYIAIILIASNLIVIT